MERAAAAGHKGIVFGSQPEVYGTPPLVSPHWDRIWEAAQSLELPINFHIASGDNTGAYDIGQLVGRTTVFAVTPVLFFLGNARAISYVIAGGICHRFPKLNFGQSIRNTTSCRVSTSSVRSTGAHGSRAARS
jgi:hypothetical protein